MAIIHRACIGSIVNALNALSDFQVRKHSAGDILVPYLRGRGRPQQTKFRTQMSETATIELSALAGDFTSKFALPGSLIVGENTNNGSNGVLPQWLKSKVETLLVYNCNYSYL